MSAWLCNDEHIKQLVGYLCHTDNPGLKRLATSVGYRSENGLVEADDLATFIAKILLAENYRSLSFRYGDDDKPHDIAVTFGEILRTTRIPAVNILHSLACYEYQACESDDWPHTMAARICKMIQDCAIRKLPGYDTAPWGQPFEFEAPAPEVISISSMMNGPKNQA